MRSVPKSSAQHSESVKEAGKIGQREKRSAIQTKTGPRNIPQMLRRGKMLPHQILDKALIEHLENTERRIKQRD